MSKAAIAAGLFFGVEMKDIVDAVTSYQPENNRSQVKMTASNTLICDSYNANPTSMSLALESFYETQALNKVVILGDMLELGEKSSDEHLKLLDNIKSHNLSKVILVGPFFQKVSAGFGFNSFPDVGKLAEFIKKEPVKGATILVKGSRGIGLEKIYSLL